nr:hypothetical protein [Actinomycetota bacterium]
MAAPRSVAPQPNIAPLVFTVAVLLAAAATWFRLPGAVVLLAGMVASTFYTVAPPMTGRKDPAGYPTIGNPGERRAMLAHRRWRFIRWRLLLPNREWLLNDVDWLRDAHDRADRFAVGPLRALVWPVMVAITVGWLLIPTTFSSLFALSAGAAVLTFPVDAIASWGLFPDADTAVWLMWPNAAAAYVAVMVPAAARRRFAAEEDPMPDLGVGDLIGTLRSRRGWAIAAAVLGPILAGLACGFGAVQGLAALSLAWLIFPGWLLAVAVAVAVASTIWWLICRRPGLAGWRNTVDARQLWKNRWEPVKLDPQPYLLTHTRHGDDEAAPVTVDMFDAPASLGASGAIALRDKLSPAVGGGMQVTVLPEPDVDGKGSPVQGTKHPTRFAVVCWPADTTVDITDPAADADLVRTRIRVAGAQAAVSIGYPIPSLLDVTPLWGDGSTAAAYATTWACPDTDITQVLPAIAGGVGGAAGTEGIHDPKQGATLYVGALTDERTTFMDESLPARFEVLEREARWRRRWSDALKMGEAQPVIQSAVYKTVQMPSGQTIECQPFMTPQGVSGLDYMTRDKEQKLAPTLSNAPWVHVIGWEGKEDRPGSRHPGAFRVLWSPTSIPLDPALIEPEPRGRRSDAIRWAMCAAVNAGFDAAKLPRPEVVSVAALTTVDSSGYIWDIRVRLYDGVTLAAVKTASEKIRSGMGATPWLRVTAMQDGIRIVAGADPTRRSVEFTRLEARKLCLAMDWEQFFTDAKLSSPVDGTAPQLVSTRPLATNEQVEAMTFTLPRGLALTDFQEQKAVDKVRAAAKKEFINIRPGDEPGTFTMLVCDVDPMPSPAPFQWDCLGAQSPRSTAFATNVEGAPVRWDLDLDSHLLVLGQNGSGKGIAMTVMVTDMLMKMWDVYAGDPIKGFNDFAFADPWLKARSTTYDQTAAMARKFLDLLDERKELNAKYGVSNIRDLPDEVRPRIACLFLDEFTSLVIPDPVIKPSADADERELRQFAEATRVNAIKRIIAAAIARVLLEGRATGLVMVLAAQKLPASLLEKIPGGPTMKSQMSRLALGKMSFGDMMSAFTDAKSALGLLGPSVPRGRGIFESTAQAAFSVQTWWAGGSQTEHFTRMAERISSVREALRDEERLDFDTITAAAPATSVFGSVVADTEERTEDHDIVDVELGLDASDFDFDTPAEEPGTEDAEPNREDAAADPGSLFDTVASPRTPAAAAYDDGLFEDDTPDGAPKTATVIPATRTPVESDGLFD